MRTCTRWAIRGGLVGCRGGIAVRARQVLVDPAGPTPVHTRAGPSALRTHRARRPIANSAASGHPLPPLHPLHPGYARSSVTSVTSVTPTTPRLRQVKKISGCVAPPDAGTAGNGSNLVAPLMGDTSGAGRSADGQAEAGPSGYRHETGAETLGTFSGALPALAPGTMAALTRGEVRQPSRRTCAPPSRAATCRYSREEDLRPAVTCRYVPLLTVLQEEDLRPGAARRFTPANTPRPTDASRGETPRNTQRTPVGSPRNTEGQGTDAVDDAASPFGRRTEATACSSACSGTPRSTGGWFSSTRGTPRQTHDSRATSPRSTRFTEDEGATGGGVSAAREEEQRSSASVLVVPNVNVRGQVAALNQAAAGQAGQGAAGQAAAGQGAAGSSPPPLSPLGSPRGADPPQNRSRGDSSFDV